MKTDKPVVVPQKGAIQCSSSLLNDKPLSGCLSMCV